MNIQRIEVLKSLSESLYYSALHLKQVVEDGEFEHPDPYECEVCTIAEMNIVKARTLLNLKEI